MIRKAYIIGILGLGITAMAVRTNPAYGRLITSAQSFQHNLREMKASGNTLSPLEKLVFSLVLAQSTPAKVPASRRS